MAAPLPGAELVWEPWGHRVSCKLGHPIGNYAFFRDYEAWKNADEFAIPNIRAFNLYLNDESKTGPELGIFEERMTLTSMVRPPGGVTRNADFLVEEARTTASRLNAARFIVSQFYSTSTAETSRIIAGAIVAAADLDLFFVSDGGGGIAGAAMLSKSASVWGIYSVCVHPDFQRRRIGANIVQELGRIASVNNRVTQLQCLESKRSWYEALEFEPHSFLHVYCV
ncbi:MAG: GNAT family N-acetyltransferase [Fimbriimonadaceae bacterium]